MLLFIGIMLTGVCIIAGICSMILGWSMVDDKHCAPLSVFPLGCGAWLILLGLVNLVFTLHKFKILELL